MLLTYRELQNYKHMKKNILVVEDERSMQMLLENFLSQSFSVVVMGHGKEAFDWLQSGQIPALIIADINMPEMDGYEFVKSLKTSGYFRDIPIIMLSGTDSSTERVKFLRLGARDYLVKPFNPEELMLRVELLLKDATV